MPRDRRSWLQFKGIYIALGSPNSLSLSHVLPSNFPRKPTESLPAVLDPRACSPNQGPSRLLRELAKFRPVNHDVRSPFDAHPGRSRDFWDADRLTRARNLGEIRLTWNLSAASPAN